MLGMSADLIWHETIKLVMRYGHSVDVVCADGETRKTLELIGHPLVMDMNRPVVGFSARKPGYRFMAADAAWILSGSDKVVDLGEYKKNVEKYSDDGITFFGAYGPKIVGQLDYVTNTLRVDPSSRRAVLTIWRENPPATKDTPCTISAQFLIRENRIQCFVTMRSSDTWIGLPYDLFTFSMLSAVVFLKLKKIGLPLTGLGNLYNVAGSRHIYEKDIELIKQLNFVEDPGPSRKFPMFNVTDYPTSEDLVRHLWGIAHNNQDELISDFIL